MDANDTQQGKARAHRPGGTPAPPRQDPGPRPRKLLRSRGTG